MRALYLSCNSTTDIHILDWNGSTLVENKTIMLRLTLKFESF